MLSCERVSFRVTSFRVSWSLGQLSAGRRIGSEAHVFHKTSAFGVMERYENMKDVCCSVHLLFVLAFTGVLGAVFARCWERDLGEDSWSLSGGCVANVWWWAVVLVNKNLAWRSWTGRLIEVLTFNIYDMLSVNAIYVHVVKQPMYCRKGYTNLSKFSECPVKRMVEGTVDK
jgi:hypothetical protein